MESTKKKKVKIRFKNKKAAIIAVVLAVAVLATVCLCVWGIVRLATKNERTVALELHPDFTITTLTGSLDSPANSISYIKNAAMSGAQIVQVDLMFNSKGEPVLTDDYNDIDSDKTVPLSKAFSTLKEFPDISIMLDLHGLTNLARVEELTEKYNMFNRIYYSGVTLENYEYVIAKSPNIPIILEADLSLEKADNLEYYDYLRDAAANAYAINVDFEDLDDAWAELLVADGQRISVYNISSEKDFSKALDMYVANVTTDKPGELQALILDWLTVK